MWCILVFFVHSENTTHVSYIFSVIELKGDKELVLPDHSYIDQSSVISTLSFLTVHTYICDSKRWTIIYSGTSELRTFLG